MQLDLSGNNITSMNFALLLNSCPNLILLLLNDNALMELYFTDALKPHKRLKILSLDNNLLPFLPNILLNKQSLLPSLTTMLMRFNSIRTIEDLRHLTHLEVLDLQCNKLTGELSAITELLPMKTLHALNLSDNYIINAYPHDFNKSVEQFHEIMPHVFISNQKFARNYRALQKRAISTIICVDYAPVIHSVHYSQLGINVELLNCNDFDHTFESKFIHAIESIQRNCNVNTLVCCSSGMTRSACIVAAHLLVINQFTDFRDAFESIGRKVKPNVIENYEQEGKLRQLLLNKMSETEGCSVQ
jgi:hypothetical protein